MEKQNLFENIPDHLSGELFEAILENKSFHLERIVSDGQSTPAGKWFDQETDEWVILLKGKAGLLFEENSEVIKLAPGDHILIPAHKRHRVEWTDEVEKTVWLALHYSKRCGAANPKY